LLRVAAVSPFQFCFAWMPSGQKNAYWSIGTSVNDNSFVKCSRNVTLLTFVRNPKRLQSKSVQYEDHLSLHEINLQPSAERKFAPEVGWSFVRLSQGAAYCFGNGSAHEFALGELLVVPAGKSVLLRASQIGLAALHHFNFIPERLTALMTLVERQQFTQLTGSIAQEVMHLPAQNMVASLFSAVCESVPQVNPFFERCRILGVAAALFEPLLQSLPRTNGVLLPGFTAQSRFMEIVQQMPEQEIVEHSPSELAQLCRCSVTRFRRMFRAQFGMSFRSKQVLLRLEKGRQLLLESDMPIKEVGTACGYASDGTFNTMFKKHFGVSPNQLRHLPNGLTESPARPS
jgi:AraC-like DNA-binding protein